MRALIVCHYFPPHIGGIENVAYQQARWLTELGVEVTVLTSAEEGSAATELPGRTIVRVPATHVIERRTGVPFPLFGPGLLGTARTWAKWADVVHVHDCLYPTSWAAGWAAVRTRTPLVLTQHVAMIDHPSAVVGAAQRLVYASAGRWLTRHARSVLVVNGRVGEFAQRLGAAPDTIHLLANGVDTELFRPAADTEKRRIRARFGLPLWKVLVLFVGRPVPKKGYSVLLGAQDADYELVFAGGPAPPDDAVGVHHLGSLAPAELAEVYRACDVFALPSTAEGFPLTVQEAMASGLPVVTTDDPGYAPYALDRSLLALVPRDSNVLRATLRTLAGDADLRARMGSYSLTCARSRFSWSAHAEQLQDRYRAATAWPGVSAGTSGGTR